MKTRIIPASARTLLDFLGSKEAPLGYDTVFGNRMDLMPKPLTSMTINEAINQANWRYKRFGSSACGRYQFMGNTLKDLKKTENMTGNERLTPAVQDQLGYALLIRRGFSKFITGQMSVIAFGKGIAQEWASMPVLAATQGQHRAVKRGDTYYLGDGLNKVLAKAPEVETVLRTVLKQKEFEAVQPAPVVEGTVISAPEATFVPAETAADNLPWWSRLFGRKPIVKAKEPLPPPTFIPNVKRPGLRPGGDPALYDIQVQLRDRNYYTKIGPDGLDGTFTQGGVAQARKDNGLGDGGIDAEFLAALPTMPRRPVPVQQATMSLGQAAKSVPEVFSPLKWVAGLGMGAIGLGGADSGGLLDQVNSSAARVNDVAGSVQSAFGVVGDMIGFVVAHKGIFLILLGVFVLWWAANKALDGWIKVRKAFF